MSTPPKIPSLILFLFCLDALLVCGFVIDAQMGSDASKRTHFLDLAASTNFPAWLLSAKYLLGAGLVWFAVRGRIQGGEPRTWALAAFPSLLAVLSFNVVTRGHESVGFSLDAVVSQAVQALTHLGTTGTKTLVVGVPVFLIVAALLYVFARSTFWKSAALWRFAMGLALPVVATLALESLGGILPREGALRLAFAAYFQMLGATLMLWAAREQAMADLGEIVQLAKSSTAGVIRPDAELPIKLSA